MSKDLPPLPNLATPLTDKQQQQLTQAWAGYFQALHQKIEDLETRLAALETP